MKVITRFAPSPTGHLHIGGARTAAFCWLLARHFNGTFLLRVEDTDTERSKQEYTDSILASMTWLGLDWDGEEIYQKDRFPIYNEHIDRLLATGHAYWCDCPPEKVEAMREKARAQGAKPKYDGNCRHRNLGPGPGRVVRLAAPLSGAVGFNDMVKGPISFDATELDDMVLRRADGAPTYNLAVVVDDMLMGVTHVIRGDDHVNNTPKQIILYRAFEAELPVFGHVPMILGPDRQKLSKRHGAKAVIEYEKDGLLPAALVNYLVRLGWSHGDQEIFTLDELVNFFDGTSLNASAAGFDPEKLSWVNAQHLREQSPETLLPLMLPFLKEIGLAAPESAAVLALIPLFQPRATLLNEMAAQMKPFLVPAHTLEYDEKAVAKALTDEGKAHLRALRGLLDQCFAANTPTPDSLHQVIQNYVDSNGLKFKQVGPPLRVALAGTLGGPELPAIMTILGHAETLARIDRAVS